jgi:adenosylcobinamide kinase/adenosylcobinamide-phosphate guanylyltransferase
MAKNIYISGGARSGKSRLAEELAQQFGAPLGYLATGQAGDPEMAQRIARHQLRRGSEWQTLEEPLDILGTIRGHDGYFSAILVDCVTLWLTNLLFNYENTVPDLDPVALALADVRKLTEAFALLQAPLILVSNEVGMGIVPENRLARLFRDLSGEANEILAQAADQVYVTFSGLPLKLKG